MSYLDYDYFKEIQIYNNSIPQVDAKEIKLFTNFMNKKVDMPVMINAITGGIEESFIINKTLGEIASEFNIPIAVGSQGLIFHKDCNIDSFKIVREVNPKGIILANLNANMEVEKVRRAIELIEADGVQLHLNALQEIIMNEGDREFKSTLNNIENIINKVNIPIILKEVGGGISYECCKVLAEIGVKYIDTGGKGGTSFTKIEGLRRKNIFYEELMDLEIPTPKSIIFCKKASKDIEIIASGGIYKPMQIIKALTVGAKMVGIAGYILKTLQNGSKKDLEEYFFGLQEGIKIILLALGCSNIDDLKYVNYDYKFEDDFNR